jgi:uncharacterized membrane-anchored protein YjiN (DUF445 family)
MDRKLLIGVSICAVVLLVLASLSNVVGYQSMKSTTANDSPLFRARIQRVIDRDSKNLLTVEYLGKGMNRLLIPLTNDKGLLYQKIIDRIGRMDDASFRKLITMVILQKNLEPTLKKINSQTIICVLYLLKNNQNTLANQNIIFNDKTNVIPLPSVQWTACIIYCILNWFVGLFSVLLLVFFTVKYHGDCLVTIDPKQCS